MSNIQNDSFAFLGLGLIGGSIAKAIRQYRPDAKIGAWDPDFLSVQLAVRDGTVNEALPAPDAPALAGYHVIFLSAPVADNLVNFERIRPLLSASSIIARPMRSFTLPAGFRYSSLARMRAPLIPSCF